MLNLSEIEKKSYFIFRGLRLLATKWAGKGFSRDLKTLLMLLEAGTAQKADMVVRVNGARWRSYQNSQ